MGSAEGRSAPLGGVVRDATADDLEAIIDIHVEVSPEMEVFSYRFPGARLSAAHAAEYRRMTEKRYRDALASAEAGDVWLVVYVFGDGAAEKVIGFATWGRFEPDAAAAAPRSLEISTANLRADMEAVIAARAAPKPSPGAGIHNEVASRARQEAFNLYFNRYVDEARRGGGGGTLYWLRVLCVLPAHRGRGAGREMVLEGLRRIRGANPPRGLGAVGLFASERAVPLYRRLGFEARGGFAFRLPADIDDVVGGGDEGGDELVIRGMALSNADMVSLLEEEDKRAHSLAC